MDSGSRPTSVVVADLPCADGRHDFGSLRFALDYGGVKASVTRHGCAHCGWSLDKVLGGHPLREMAHYLRIARQVSQGKKA
jgi:hypothetical protein